MDSEYLDLDTCEIVENLEIDNELDRVFKYEPVHLPDTDKFGNYNFNFIRNCSIITQNIGTLDNETCILRQNNNKMIHLNIHNLVKIKLVYFENINYNSMSTIQIDKSFEPEFKYIDNKITQKVLQFITFIKICFDYCINIKFSNTNNIYKIRMSYLVRNKEPFGFLPKKALICNIHFINGQYYVTDKTKKLSVDKYVSLTTKTAKINLYDSYATELQNNNESTSVYNITNQLSCNLQAFETTLLKLFLNTSNEICDFSKFIKLNFECDGVKLYYDNQFNDILIKNIKSEQTRQFLCSENNYIPAFTKYYKQSYTIDKLQTNLKTEPTLLLRWLLPLNEFKFSVELKGLTLIFGEITQTRYNQPKKYITLEITEIANPVIREYFQNLASGQDTTQVSKDLYTKYKNAEMTIDQFTYLTPEYKQRYLNTLVTQKTRFDECISKYFGIPDSINYVYEVLRLCTLIDDIEYVDIILSALQHTNNSPRINFKLLQQIAIEHNRKEILKLLLNHDIILYG